MGDKTIETPFIIALIFAAPLKISHLTKSRLNIKNKAPSQIIIAFPEYRYLNLKPKTLPCFKSWIKELSPSLGIIVFDTLSFLISHEHLYPSRLDGKLFVKAQPGRADS